jgi:hypothetical protein
VRLLASEINGRDLAAEHVHSARVKTIRGADIQYGFACASLVDLELVPEEKTES